MQSEQIAAYRSAAQRISQADFEQPEDAVRHLLAMQAQDYTGALWSIGLRTKGSTLTDVEQAIIDRKLVRTWPMRGTLHFLHADDVHWMVDLLAPRATQSAKSRRINLLGLTDAVVGEAETALRSELKGGKSIVRGDVVKLLAAKVKGIAIGNQHTQHLMRNFGERGIICFGPHAGKQPTFVLLDEWIPKPPPTSREDALKELAIRYFKSHGPATLNDFAGWAYLPMADVRQALQMAQDELSHTVICDTCYYFDPVLEPLAASGIFLLPGFDEYLLGYKDRSAMLSPNDAAAVVPGGNGMFLPTIVVDGQVVGIWNRTIRKSAATFNYDMFKGRPPARQLLRPAEERYGHFLFG